MSQLPVSGIVHKLKELCQCSICFNIPPGRIYNCPTGHSVCQACYSRLQNCPSCEKPYQKKGGGSRNFEKENLCKYYSEVIASTCVNIPLEDLGIGNALPSTSRGDSKIQGGQFRCPYKGDGCSESRGLNFTRQGGTSLNGSNVEDLIEHTRECEFR